MLGLFKKSKNSLMEKAYKLADQEKYDEALKCYDEILILIQVAMLHGMVEGWF